MGNETILKLAFTVLKNLCKEEVLIFSRALDKLWQCYEK